MFTSETPMLRSVACSSRPKSAASAAERRSGSVTISTSGVPQRLKSTTLDSAPWMRPELPAWTSFAASAAAAERDVVLADLVRLRAVGIEVVLAVEDRPRGDLATQREPDHQAE